MAGETESAQALWDEVAQEREADPSPSQSFEQAKPAAEANTDLDDPTPDSESQPNKAQAKEPEKAPDPFEGLPEAVKARLLKLDALEAQVAEIPKLVQNVKTAEGRVAAMQREMDVAKQAAKAVGNAPSNAQIAAAKQSTEKWDLLKQEFPEWADATAEYVSAALAGISPQQASTLDPTEVQRLIDSRLETERVELQRAVEEAKVEGKYENWKEIVKGDEFMSWFDAQPEDVQALAQSSKGRDAVRMLDLFHKAKETPAGAVQQTRAAKLAAAVNQKPGSSGTVTKSVDEMTPQELWNYEAQRNRKRGAEKGLVY